jgi:8-oxo-dGTP pyrophosphatase MutT (NUDIX family)
LFKLINSKSAYQGQMISVSLNTYRYEDGSEVQRDVVDHPGAVAIIAHDDTHIYLVKQPREATGDQALLEVPAGKLDPGRDGESPDPLAAAKRELAEEIGRGANSWEYLFGCYTTPGFTNEFVHIFLATDLKEEKAQAEEEERIEIVKVKLAELDETISTVKDSKTLICLLELRRRLITS